MLTPVPLCDAAAWTVRYAAMTVAANKSAASEYSAALDEEIAIWGSTGRATPWGSRPDCRPGENGRHRRQPHGATTVEANGFGGGERVRLERVQRGETQEPWQQIRSPLQSVSLPHSGGGA